VLPALVALALLAGTAIAQEAPADKPAAAWGGGWKAGVEETTRDVVSGEAMVVIAYTAVWVILLLYVLRLAAELRALRRETEDLKRMIEERAGGGPPAG
jgi:CcmD family protein